MKITTSLLLVLTVTGTLGVRDAQAECVMADARLEEAILNKPEFRDPANRQMVKDLRHLRDSAFVLWTYGLEAQCNQLLAGIRELIASPSMGSLGGSDEDMVEQQVAAQESLVQRGGAALGRRNLPGAAPLVSADQIRPGLRADEIIGAEVRTADDKIVGEVRNIVLATENRRNYAVVASGGFFVPGKDSFVVPIQFLMVSEGRESYYLLIDEGKLKSVPLMPDRQYEWLADEVWRRRNDALFALAP
ncbi:MAG: PRC-barrel domain-containing protein [Alphaproteobacteria bacterium]|nr:PRC-barrel domain-containing protein [Alphaproteobacteria bacterium]